MSAVSFVAVSVVGFLMYLALTTGSGTELAGLWSGAEVALGIIVALTVAAVTFRFYFQRSLRMLHPLRWLVFLGYLVGPFFIALTKANLDVAYRVITGRINPGIVRISPGLRSDLGVTMLANSITLTPGTLTVDIDKETNDLFVHWINVDERTLGKGPVDCAALCGRFPAWVRKVTE